MIKKSTFDVFGKTYRTEQFAAIPGLEVIEMESSNPAGILSKTEVFDEGVWRRLDNQDAINKYVSDGLNIIAPRLVLNGLVSLVGDFSFGFVRTWKSTRVPRRFMSGANSVESPHVNPTIMVLMTEDIASKKLLEEYYSLEDAYIMFDAFVVKGINSALAQEAAALNAR